MIRGPNCGACYAASSLRTHPKAWGLVGFDAALIAGYGVASAPWISTGRYRVTLSTPMSSSNYSVIATVYGGDQWSGGVPIIAINSTSQFEVRITDYWGNEPDPRDRTFSFAVFGDQ